MANLLDKLIYGKGLDWAADWYLLLKEQKFTFENSGHKLEDICKSRSPTRSFKDYKSVRSICNYVRFSCIYRPVILALIFITFPYITRPEDSTFQ